MLKVAENIVLRLAHPEFALSVFKIIDEQRSYLGEWLPWVENTRQVSDTVSFLKESHLYNQGGQRLTSFIFLKDELVGSVSFIRFDRSAQSAEMGYWISQTHQGKGIISRSAQRLIQHGFTKLNLQRIEIRMAAGNQPSRAIPERLGFQQEGTLRSALLLKDKFHDLLIYGLLKSDAPAFLQENRQVFTKQSF